MRPYQMSANRKFTRRTFLRNSTTGAALLGFPTIIPARVLGADAPSNKITIGMIGVGDHGTGWNLSYLLKNSDARVVAVCDVDSNRLFRAKETVNERYGNEDCFATKDFREVLARKDIDAVMIS